MSIATNPQWLALLLVVTLMIVGCGQSPNSQHGHDKHTNREVKVNSTVVYTDFSEQTELFVEFPPLVANQASKFLVHVTRLADFKPLNEGTLEVLLQRDQKTMAGFRVKKPARSGIFIPSVIPRTAGKFDLVIKINSGDLNTVHQLGKIEVFSNRASAQLDQVVDDGEISYLKEQQWENTFALTTVKKKPLRSSVQGVATVYASETAEISGLVGYLQNRSHEEEDYGEALVALERSRGNAELAQQEVQRLENLYQTGAIPKKQLNEARKAYDVAKITLKVAKARLQHHAPGSNVTIGSKRWLHIRVPEYTAARLQQVSGAWFKYNDTIHVLDMSNDTKVVKVGGAVDPVSRTVPIVLEYPAAKGPILIGASLTAHVYTQVATEKLALPVSAVIDDGGRSVVYVQTSGESFTRRAVQLGVQDGAWIEVLSGVTAGERVVSKGAYYVKLASIGGEEIGHGHAH